MPMSSSSVSTPIASARSNAGSVFSGARPRAPRCPSRSKARALMQVAQRIARTRHEGGRDMAAILALRASELQRDAAHAFELGLDASALPREQQAGARAGGHDIPRAQRTSAVLRMPREPGEQREHV